MRRIPHTLFTVTALTTGLLFDATGRPAKAEQIVALTTQSTLLRFDSATPGAVLGNSTILGLQSGEALLGIDFRPANGQLYGLSNTSRLYTINPLTGLATFAVALSTPLTGGSSYGIDFNPVVDRLRVVHSDARTNPLSNQNLRIDVDTGIVIADGALTPAKVVSPLDPNIGAAAYTNNFSGATSTTLYDIDFFRDRLVIQNPPDSGTLVRVGELAPIGAPPMGADITNEMVGFDISGLSGIAYASLTSPATGVSSLYTIDLGTGAATLVGSFGNGFTVSGLAAPVGTPVPESASVLLLGMGIAWIGVTRILRKK
ncbi:MAG: DUF4394 domain-containing protein [Bryobacteraceae bacterium]